ncbi:hypothetical protein [Pimelobacter sp. 30-1]|uniref:hypothetical protein n=1 Tax=Pimelobacter sp. 30-1 TaxID=2004991 RepID=UPI001C04E5D4|nr:hypothetical protein [Pimelobacter sp. 30-1]MBU2694660.1 hypothetical protein [Pimelobacter sp. 30-1]
MSKRIKHVAAGLVATAAAGTAILATTVPAHALSNYTPTASGGAVTFTGSSVSFTDIEAGQTLTCSTFNLSGTVTNNGVARTFGSEGGQLGSLTSSGCTNPIAGATTVTPSGTWKVKVTGPEVVVSSPASQKSPATLYDINADITAAGCTFDVGGSVAGSFNETDQKFTPNSGASGLTITTTPMGGPGYTIPNGGTCATLDVQLGDTISVGGYWTASGLTITNS